MFRLMLSARWIAFAVFVVVLAAVCTRLGMWQFHRLDHRIDRNAIISKHLAADPVELQDALGPGKRVTADLEYTRVRATGTYDVAHQVTMKFSTREGAPGVDVVTPLVLASGEALLVNRGWQQTSNTVDRPNVPAPPDGEVTITGWLRADSRAGDDAVRPHDGQIRAISSRGFAASVPYDLVGGYVNLRSESPEPANKLAAEPVPDRGQGPHFFYALQWWFFALLAVIGYFWFAHAEAKERRNPTRIDGFAKPGADQARLTRST